MTLNGIMALTMRHFNEFAKPAFQLITVSSSIELIDQKLATRKHRAVKLLCITKFTHSRVDTSCKSFDVTYVLSTKFHFTVTGIVLATYLYKYAIPDAVPPIHAVSSHVATNKGPS